MSRQIDKLEKHGLVVTQDDIKDARIRVIKLSPKGEQITEVINQTRLSQLESAFSDWSDTDKKALLDNLSRLAKTLDNLN